jgi:hypothetical protein
MAVLRRGSPSPRRPQGIRTNAKRRQAHTNAAIPSYSGIAVGTQAAEAILARRARCTPRRWQARRVVNALAVHLSEDLGVQLGIIDAEQTVKLDGFLT